MKQVHESVMYNNREIPRSTRSDASDQEEEESESCPVSISMWDSLLLSVALYSEVCIHISYTYYFC